MSYRHISTETKVEIMKETLTLCNINHVKERHKVSDDSIYIWFHKIIDTLPETLANKKPGVKPKEETSGPCKDKGKILFFPHLQDERPKNCSFCGSPIVWKNGLYQVTDWTFCVLGLFLPKKDKTSIQRYICANCRREIYTTKKARLKEAREITQVYLKRFFAFCKFALPLSYLQVAKLASFLFGFSLSASLIYKVSQDIGTKAKEILKKISSVPQKTWSVLMGDETFPKNTAKSSKNDITLGVTCCEYGLIRGVKAICKKTNDLYSLFANSINKDTLFFLSDFDKKYPEILKIPPLSKLIHLRDWVHAVRIVCRHFKEAIRNTQAQAPKGASLKEKKHLTKTKRRLLAHQLAPIKKRLLSGFTKEKAPVFHFYLCETLERLENFPVPMEEVRILKVCLAKFFNKYLDILLFPLKEGYKIPLTTTNILEGIMSVFRPFRLIAKAYRKPTTMENHFCGIALFANCEIKRYGKNKETSLLQRAGIDPKDLGGKDFFEMVGLALKEPSFGSPNRERTQEKAVA